MRCERIWKFCCWSGSGNGPVFEQTVVRINENVIRRGVDARVSVYVVFRRHVVKAEIGHTGHDVIFVCNAEVLPAWRERRWTASRLSLHVLSEDQISYSRRPVGIEVRAYAIVSNPSHSNSCKGCTKTVTRGNQIVPGVLRACCLNDIQNLYEYGVECVVEAVTDATALLQVSNCGKAANFKKQYLDTPSGPPRRKQITNGIESIWGV